MPHGRPSLFDPIRLGNVQARNRILMAPMTRGRATRDHVPTPLMQEHYTQRASAGLIISEATGISRQGLGWPYANGNPPVSCSATTPPGDARTYMGRQAYVEARQLSVEEISAIVRDFAQAALNCRAAGFDAVQLHAGSGYLIDQFLRDGTNRRTDRYGGSIANRLRFLLEIIDAIGSALSPGELSVRFSPNAATQGCADSDSLALFSAAAAELRGVGLAFLELREPGPGGIFGITDSQPVSPVVRQCFDGNLVLNEDYDLAQSQRSLTTGHADAISFGRAFISNPDLPHRLERELPLTADSRAHWYTPGPQGYTDYSSHETVNLTCN